MKFALCWILSLMLLLPPSASTSAAAAVEHEFLILMSFGGTQSGGDEAAFIDAQGGLYYIDMAAENLYWRGEETLSMLRTLPDSYKISELAEEELAEIRRLIDGIEIEKPVQYGVCACDAGSFRQVAYRTLESGERQELILLAAGDNVYENMDKNAIILSSRLLDLTAFSRYLKRWSFLFPYGDSVPLSVSFERGSFFGGSRTYTLRREGDRVRFSVQGTNGDEIDVRAEIDDASGYFYHSGIVVELHKMITEYGIPAWNGFDEHDSDILDGDGFSLFIDYGTSSIKASGYESYPEGYEQASAALEAFFGDLILRATTEAE